jgi:glycosyltransferase involved in cell wall biosynthesis
MDRRILIISYHYPPDMEIGGQRAAQFVKYLPSVGIQPCVLTVKEKYYKRTDPVTVFSPIVQNAAIRTIVLPWFRDIYLALASFLKGKRSINSISRSGTVPSQKTAEKESLVAKTKRIVFSIFFWLPDDRVGWIVPAFTVGARYLKKNDIKVIMTTGPPHSTHLTGLLLKMVTGKKWLVDLRDPWIGSQRSAAARSSFSDAIERWLEKRVVRYCDRLICVTSEMTELYRKRYPEIDRQRFVTLFNGFDEEEIKSFRSVKKHHRITFTYTGTLYLNRDPELFLKAVSSLILKGKLDISELAIRFVGNCRFIGEKPVEQLVRKLGLESAVTFIDPIPRKEAMLESAKAHVLILFAQNQPLQIPGKLYDYMGLGANILAICEEGASYRMLSQYKRAVIVEREELETMEQAVLAVWKLAKVQGGEETDQSSAFVEKFNRKKLTEELAEYI